MNEEINELDDVIFNVVTIDKELIERFLEAVKPLFYKKLSSGRPLINNDGQITRLDNVHFPLAARDREWFYREEQQEIRKWFEHTNNYFRGKPIIWLGKGNNIDGCAYNNWYVQTRDYHEFKRMVLAVHRKTVAS